MANYNEKRDAENRYFCPLCICWIANNKFNLSLHENSARHKANVQRKMNEMKQKDREEEKIKRDIEIMKRKATQGNSAGSKNGIVLTEEQKKKEEQLHDDVRLRFALPPNWAPYTDQNSGQVYYYNSVTGQSQWQRPMYSSEEIERIKAEKEKRELEEELKRKKSNEKINEKIALENQKAKGIPLTREQKQKEMKEEEERMRKMIEDSKEEEKKLLLNFDPKNPFGEWKEETSSSYIYEHSEELKKRDNTKAQKEKERLQKLQNNSSSSSSSSSSSLSTTNEEEDELEEAEESLNNLNREERGGIGMGIGSRYEQRLISQLPSVLRTIGETSTEEKAEKEEKKKNFIASLVEKKREEDERKEEERFVKTLKGEEEDIKEIKEELEEKEENRDNDKKESVNKQTPPANKKISFSLKKKDE